MSDHQLGDAPVEARYRSQMQAIMAAVDDFMNPDKKNRKVGIVVLTFPFGAVDGRCNFMSNGANREDLVVLFKEMIARFEGQPKIRGRG